MLEMEEFANRIENKQSQGQNFKKKGTLVLSNVQSNFRLADADELVKINSFFKKYGKDSEGSQSFE